MKIRTCVLVWLMSVTLPIVLSGTGVVLGPLQTSRAHAQQPDAVTALARERFLEGVKAYDQGRYEEARSLFLQAYALKRHPAVLLNLGQSELKSGHVAEGGNHLQQFLREHKTATAAQQQAARQGITEAKARVAHLIVIVDVDGAQVSVDGVAAGTSPLLDPVFVKPGDHTVTAAMSGKTVSSKVAARRGTATPVSLSLQAAGVVPAPAPAPTPAPTPAPGPTAPGTYPAPTAPAPGPTATAPEPAPLPPPPTEPKDTGRENFFKWYGRKPVAWVLTGVAGLGLIGSIAFGAAAASADSNADEVSQSILDEVGKWRSDPTASGHLPAAWYENGDTANGQPQPCGDFDDPATAYPYYAGACDTLRDNVNAYDTDIALMVVSMVVLAGGVGGTIVYYFVDTGDGDAPGSVEAEASGNISVGPIITPYTQGVGVVGTF